MKKTILTGFAILAIAFIGRAQEGFIDYREKFIIGVKAGLNLSNVYNSEGEEFVADNKLGLATGVFVAIPIGKYLGVQPEILFSQKGFQATGRLLGDAYSFTRTSNFIDVPIFFAFKPSEIFTLMAGPQYSFLMKQTDEFASGSGSVDQVQEFENDNIRKNIFCFIGGGDLTLNNIVVGARVGWDLTENNGDGTSETPRYKNVWYQATLGYRF